LVEVEQGHCLNGLHLADDCLALGVAVELPNTQANSHSNASNHDQGGPPPPSGEQQSNHINEKEV
jgi:hypothetical protein